MAQCVSLGVNGLSLTDLTIPTKNCMTSRRNPTRTPCDSFRQAVGDSAAMACTTQPDVWCLLLQTRNSALRVFPS